MTKILTSGLEDYVEAIFLLQLEKGVARVKDVAQMLKVTKASVVGALKILQDKGLIVHEKYGYIELTQKGILKAEEIYRKHKNLCSFFTEILKVDLEQAEKDACGIEHHISERTLRSLIALADFLREKRELLIEFHKYLSEKRKSSKKNIE